MRYEFTAAQPKRECDTDSRPEGHHEYPSSTGTTLLLKYLDKLSTGKFSYYLPKSVIRFYELSWLDESESSLHTRDKANFCAFITGNPPTKAPVHTILGGVELFGIYKIELSRMKTLIKEFLVLQFIRRNKFLVLLIAQFHQQAKPTIQ